MIKQRREKREQRIENRIKSKRMEEEIEDRIDRVDRKSRQIEDIFRYIVRQLVIQIDGIEFKKREQNIEQIQIEYCIN